MVGQRGRLLLACALATGCSDSGPTASNVVGPVAGERASTPIYTQVAITTNGGWGDDVSGNETPKSCSTFKVKAGDVSRYFATAKPVDSRAFYHDLDACSNARIARHRRSRKERVRWTTTSKATPYSAASALTSPDPAQRSQITPRKAARFRRDRFRRATAMDSPLHPTLWSQVQHPIGGLDDVGVTPPHPPPTASTNLRPHP